ncbi:MAG: Bestrophin, RFP-TM, chloride channel-domain-containing protein [Monoraphidium minutum]|nr:MAG: Bestrophin, RFP-TM, chloride channel-domain-containing protein [Monoraphidium minutum]
MLQRTQMRPPRSGAAAQLLRRAAPAVPRRTGRVRFAPRAEAMVAQPPPAVAHTLHPEDAVKESARQFARTVFDHDNWEAHRSSARFARHLLGLFGSRTFFGLMRPLLYVSALSAFAVAFEAARAAGLLPAFAPALQVNSQLFGLTSFALSLLLVFRTNASYERWDSARKMWGLVLNRSRDLARQGLTHIGQEQQELRAMLCRWVAAFSRALMCHLRRDRDAREELGAVLLPEEVEQVLLATHRPNFVLQVLSEIVRAGGVRAPVLMRMEDNLTNYEDCLGGCERILKTPIPLSYTRHTSRSLMIWLTLLPFALVGSCGLATIPICAITAFLLLGVEEIGVSIEEPFSILPLEAISRGTLPPGGGAPPGPRRMSAAELVQRHAPAGAPVAAGAPAAAPARAAGAAPSKGAASVVPPVGSNGNGSGAVWPQLRASRGGGGGELVLGR